MKKSTMLLLGGAAVAAYCLTRPPKATGMAGDVEISADLPADFKNGVPGIYQIGVKCPNVSLLESQRSRFNPATWNNLFQSRGMGHVRVTEVHFSKDTNAHYRNSAYGLIKDITGISMGQGDPNDVFVDKHLVFTVQIDPQGGSGQGSSPSAKYGGSAQTFSMNGLSDLGLGPIAIGLAIVALIGVGIALYDSFANTNYLVEWCKKIGKGAGSIISEGVTKPASEIGYSVVIPILLGVGALVMLAGKSKLRAGPVSAG